MSKELVIGSNRHETKVAILEDDQLVEVYFQRENEYSLAGSIHKGKVTRVLPGMQSAFVDLGLERDTFLYVSDFFEEHEDIDTVAEESPRGTDRRERNQARVPDRREPERPNGAPSVQPLAVRVEEAPIEDETAEEEEAFPPAVSASPIVVSESRDSETGAPPRTANPTGDRAMQGDRRGRRSRRRRQRGRGFPETKYAQPGQASTPPLTAEGPEPEVVEVEQAEVILLPGESLAKYRNVAPARPQVLTAAEEAQPPDSEPDTDYEDAGADTAAGSAEREPVGPGAYTDDEVEADEDLEAEAEAIASAERILSHHDDEPPEAVEEKIAEVQQDVPEPERETDEYNAAAASGYEAAEMEDVRRTHGLDRLDDAAARETAENIVFAEGSSIPEPSDSSAFLERGDDLGTGTREEFREEAEAASVDEGIPPVDESIPDNALPASDPGVFERRGDEDEAEPGVQTASVREQGGRSMHRISRRMRRRRGAGRFGNQQGQSEGFPVPENRAVESPAPLAGPVVRAAAGAALAPEPRPEARTESRRELGDDRSERVYPSISDLLKPGQEIIVQIAKEPLGQKGARITSHIALPGRYVVFMPSVSHLGVSRKVASDEERQRLKRILQAHRAGTTGGFIVRTAGEGVPEEEIAADMNFLYSLWLDIRQKAEKKPAPLLLHHDLDIVQRILRDQITEEFKAIWVDNEELYESVLTFMQRFQPMLVNRVKMYTRPAPIFDAFNITQELEKALRPKVWLKSGGYIVINQTEALVAIDVNTGKYVGKSNRLEDTIVKTNTEAVKEIVRQIRLRDLGGIIVVDFIDMDERKNRQRVMQTLEEAMRSDKAPYKILQFNDFGLVAITRKRVKQSLERTLCAPCPYCEGAGYVKSVGTVISEILVEAQKISRALEGKDAMLRVHPEVAKVLKASDNKYLEELEELLGRPVLVAGDPTLHHQKFDLM